MDGEPKFRSQFGEDRILEREFGDRPPGYFVDVGSYDGENCSNTFFLEKSLLWTGALIEADPKLHAEGQSVRPRSTSINVAVVGPDSPPTVSFEIVEGCRWVSSLSVNQAMLKRIEDVPTQITKVTVPARTLDHILESVAAPQKIDIVSIDVEGHEWSVLQGFSVDRWKPRIIILERNDHFPDSRIMRYMHSSGYGWRRTTGCNDWFYADAGAGNSYRLRLFFLFYLPKYCTFFNPLMLRPLKRVSKNLLRTLGLLVLARQFLGKKPASPRIKIPHLESDPACAGLDVDMDEELNSGIA